MYHISIYFSVLGGGRRAVSDHVGYLISKIGAHGEGLCKSKSGEIYRNPKHAQESILGNSDCIVNIVKYGILYNWSQRACRSYYNVCGRASLISTMHIIVHNCWNCYLRSRLFKLVIMNSLVICLLFGVLSIGNCKWNYTPLLNLVIVS